MDTIKLPDAIEPTYWNVVFHPSTGRLARILVGRFQHVSAFTYIAGFRAWVLYDCQWGGTRIGFFSQVGPLIVYSRGCAIIKFDRAYRPLAIASRFGFYCVPAVKQLLGLSCVAAFPDGLYRHLVANGGIPLHGQRIDTSTAAAGSDAGGRTAASAG
jgi:hypothetical protein